MFILRSESSSREGPDRPVHGVPHTLHLFRKTVMTKAILCCAILCTATVQAQWVQSGLNCNLGRSLYTDGTTIYASSAQGVYTTSGTGDPWFSIGPAGEDIFCVTSAGTKLIAGSLSGRGIFLSTNGGQNW